MKKIILMTGFIFIVIGFVIFIQVKNSNPYIIELSTIKESKKIDTSELTQVNTHTKEEEQKAIAIDEYNFRQLEKVKIVLDPLNKGEFKFYGLQEFNKKYHLNITPIKNCYYVNSINGLEKYIFGFQLESNLYIKQNGDKYYSYPKYNLPVEKIPKVGDMVLKNFLQTISNPCQD